MPSYAVIGASRGIGLEYIRQLAAIPDATVFPIVRSARSSNHLTAAAVGLKNVHILEADVTDYGSLECAAKQVADKTGGSLDYLIHNAARMDLESVQKGFDSFATMDELDEDFITSFKINALGVIHSIHAFLPLLRAGSAKRIVAIGTAGVDPKFIRAAKIDGMTAYGMTKAASLVAATKWAVKLAPEGFTVITLSPGLVDTSDTLVDVPESVDKAELFEKPGQFFVSLGFPSFGAQTVEQSVGAQLKVVHGLTTADNGKFFAHTGEEYALY